MVDDFQILIWGIEKLIGSVSNIEIVGVANTHKLALEQIAQKKPDVVLINSTMLEGGLIEFIPQILNVSYSNILVFSGAEEVELHDLVVRRRSSPPRWAR